MEKPRSNVTKASILAFMSLVAIVSNSFVAYILLKRRKVLLRNRPTYQFLLNVLLSDLVIGVFICPFEFVRELLGEWILGKAPCKIIEFVEIATLGTAIFTHALIAVDRYRSLVHPHLPKLNGKRVKQMVALSWCLPAIVSAPHIYKFDVRVINHKLVCTPFALLLPWLDKLYEAVDFAVVFFLPFCVICWCYCHVIQVTFGRGTVVAGQPIPTSQITLQRSKTRVTKTACLVVLAFVICWFPSCVLSIWRISSGTESVPKGSTIYEVSLFGGVLNEAITPVIYCIFDRNMNGFAYVCCKRQFSDDYNLEATSSRSRERNRDQNGNGQQLRE